MTAVDRLRRDHTILSSKLDVLASALSMGAETWYVLREVCFTLARQLRDHIKREEELVAACRAALNPKVLANVVVEHRDEPAHLRAINRLFVSATSRSLEEIKPALTQVIEGLRHHMAEEETELFPILDRVIAEHLPPAPAEPVRPRPARRLEEEMSVNRVVQEFPHTRRVFEQLFINVPLEGCTCLDEVAWRHGMDSRELLKTLEDAIRSCECAKGEADSDEQATLESVSES